MIERIVKKAVQMYNNPKEFAHGPRLTALCETFVRSLEDCEEGGVLEIGVDLGVTSLIFLNLMDELKDIRVFQAVDCYDSDIQPGYGDQYLKALGLITARTADMGKIVWRLYPVSDQAYMQCIYPMLTPRFQKYAFVYLDGPHDTESVRKEVFFFADHVLPGGHIVIDDIALFDELGPILKEMDKLKGWELDNIPNATRCRRPKNEGD
jgi:hypothetical protein